MLEVRVWLESGEENDSVVPRPQLALGEVLLQFAYEGMSDFHDVVLCYPRKVVKVLRGELVIEVFLCTELQNQFRRDETQSRLVVIRGIFLSCIAHLS